MIRQEINDLIKEVLSGAKEEKILPEFDVPEIFIEKPIDIKFGDYSSNIAMKIAGLVKKNPMEVAEIIAKKAGEISDESVVVFDKIEAVKPGFVNFFVSNSHWQTKVAGILEQGGDFIKVDIGHGQKVQVEFISANPTGPLTVGNSRGGIIGDVLASVLAKSNWQVTREYYFNDAGGQIDVLGHSVLKDELAEYKGEYIDKLNDELKGGDYNDYKETGKQAAKILIGQIKETTQKMGINFDVWFAEGRDLRDNGKVDEIIRWLKEKDLTYEKEGALWFKSTNFSDEKDRVLIKSNGEPTYFAVDCAYHKNKFIDRKFDRIINVWGADHHGDVPRIKGFVKALGFEDKFVIIVHQFVRVMKDGKEIRMSKRAGNYVLVEELLAEVGKDAYRFFMLQYSSSTHMDFDLQLAKEQSQKNPVYYVQYAYARLCSILRKAKEGGFKMDEKRVLKLVPEYCEPELIRKLVQLPEIVEDTARDYQVQRLPQYALDLVRTFHRYYEECRVISEDKEKTAARLGLIEATKIVLKNVLDLMGVSAPEKM